MASYQVHPGRRRITRRQALSGLGLVAAATALSACGSATAGSSQAATAANSSTASAGSATATAATATAATTTSIAASTSGVATTTTANATMGSTAAATPAGVAAAGGPQTALYWFLPLSAAAEIAIWTQFVDRFQQAYPDVKINGAYESWGNYWTKLVTVMAGGAIPDVVWLHYTYLADWASKNVMLPLDTYLATDKIDPRQYVFNDAMVYKGKMYALPKDNGVNAMWFNKDMFRTANAAEPGFQYSWNDWLTAMQELSVVKSGKQWGTVRPQTTSPRGEGFYTWFASLGGTLYNSDMTSALIDQVASINALQFMADIVNKQHVAPPAGAISQPGDPWLNQLVATTWAHHGEEFSYQVQKETFPYDEVYYPQGPGNKLVISGGTTGFAIPKQSKHLDKAWTLTTFMTGEEQQKVIVGQHRWGAGLRKLVPLQYSPGYNTANYNQCHVDPLTGKGPQAVAAPSPAALAQIEQVWGSLLDPVWQGKQQAKDVAPTLKQQMDNLLQQPTQI